MAGAASVVVLVSVLLISPHVSGLALQPELELTQPLSPPEQQLPRPPYCSLKTEH